MYPLLTKRSWRNLNTFPKMEQIKILILKIKVKENNRLACWSQKEVYGINAIPLQLPEMGHKSDSSVSLQPKQREKYDQLQFYIFRIKLFLALSPERDFSHGSLYKEVTLWYIISDTISWQVLQWVSYGYFLYHLSFKPRAQCQSSIQQEIQRGRKT